MGVWVSHPFDFCYSASVGYFAFSTLDFEGVFLAILASLRVVLGLAIRELWACLLLKPGKI